MKRSLLAVSGVAALVAGTASPQCAPETSKPLDHHSVTFVVTGQGSAKLEYSALPNMDEKQITTALPWQFTIKTDALATAALWATLIGTGTVTAEIDVDGQKGLADKKTGTNPTAWVSRELD